MSNKFLVGLCTGLLGLGLSITQGSTLSDFNSGWNSGLEPVCYSGSSVVSCNCEEGNAVRGCVRNARQTVGSFTNSGDVQVRKLVRPTSTPGTYNVYIGVRGKKTTKAGLNTCTMVLFDISNSMRECDIEHGAFINEDGVCRNAANTGYGYIKGSAGLGEKRHNAVSGAILFSHVALDTNPNAKVGLWFFGTDAASSPKVALGHDEFTPENFEGLQVNGNTNLHHGLIRAGNYLSGADDCEVKNIVIMSDGVPTYYRSGNDYTGDVKPYTIAKQKAIDKATELKESGIVIYAIGYEITVPGKEVLMEIVSEDANYSDADQSNIQTVFQNIGGKPSKVNAGKIISIDDPIGDSMNRISSLTNVSGNNITENGSAYLFQISIDPSVTGFHKSNSGLTLRYRDATGDIQELKILPSNSAEIYWSQLSVQVDFDLNGGSGNIPPVIVEPGTNIDKPSPDPTKTGYHLTGWTLSGERFPFPSPVTGDITLVADWEPNNYQVQFNKNGGNGTMGNQQFIYDVTGNLNNNAYTRTGYHFTGWNTQPSGNGTKYKNGAAVKNLATTGIVPLYAQWEPNKYTIIFSGNGSTNGSMSNQPLTYDTTGTLNPNLYGKEGFNFVGWNTKADGTGTGFVNQAQVKNLATTGTVTLYAQWSQNTYDIRFNKNGGNGTMPNQHLQYGVTGTLSPNQFARTGYHFTGWNTQANGNGTKYKNEAQVKNLATTGVVDLYAQWEPNKYTIIFSGNGGNGTMPDQALTYDTTGTLNPNQFGKTGYHFTGWNTKADGTGTPYKDEAQVKNLATTGKITLYGQREPNTYTIIFDGNGSTEGAMDGLVVKYDEEVNLTKNVYKRNKYTFKLWNTANNGVGTNYSDEQLVKNLATEGEIRLYAIRKAKGSTGGGGGGGGGRDNCPDGDYSGDFYDGKCGTPPSPTPEVETKEITKPDPDPSPIPDPTVDVTKECSIEGSTHSAEVNEAYVWACQRGIIKSNTIQGARLGEFLNRAEMAKITTVFEMLEVGSKPDRSKDCSAFADSMAGYNQEMKNYMITSCQLLRMGIHTADYTPIPDFMPRKFVSRAEFGTILSRILWGNRYEAAKNSRYYYVEHLNKLKENGILTNIDPTLVERRSYAILMIYRAAKMMGKI